MVDFIAKFKHEGTDIIPTFVSAVNTCMEDNTSLKEEYRLGET